VGRALPSKSVIFGLYKRKQNLLVGGRKRGGEKRGGEKEIGGHP